MVINLAKRRSEKEIVSGILEGAISLLPPRTKITIRPRNGVNVFSCCQGNEEVGTQPEPTKQQLCERGIALDSLCVPL